MESNAQKELALALAKNATVWANWDINQGVRGEFAIKSNTETLHHILRYLKLVAEPPSKMLQH